MIGIDPYQYARSYSAGMQEFIEAYSYYEYLMGIKLSDWDNLQERLVYTHHVSTSQLEKEENETENINTPEMVENIKENQIRCPIQPMEFMLGIADLSGEIMRRCVNSLGNGDFKFCFAAKSFLQKLNTG